MTISFATAGIGQVYLERILGLGYLDTQLKIQVHLLMLTATASLFILGAALFVWDFFRHAPNFEPLTDSERDERGVGFGGATDASALT
jgi:nitric oxide reductase subunit B